MSDFHDIGRGVSISYYVDHAGGEPVGFLYRHPAGSQGGDWEREQGYCEGRIEFKSEKRPNGWTLVSRDPLTVTPSLACSCGHHGFVTDGKWVPA